MLDIGPDNVVDYLRSRRVIGETETAEAGFLRGGVSNKVIRVETAERSFVLKQALHKLRVKQEWFSNVDRVLREGRSMRLLKPLITRCTIPDVFLLDEENCLILMSAAPDSAVNYKTNLLNGIIEPAVAERLGEVLGEIHLRTEDLAQAKAGFGDIECFHQLRVDPFYWTISRVHPDVAPAVKGIVEKMLGNKITLVHGDFSPKNILVDREELTLLDFEVVHYGDPAFDIGFFITHLLAKAVHRSNDGPRYLDSVKRFWQTYWDRFGYKAYAELECNAVEHVGCLLLARVDGKSPVDYLRGESLKEKVRSLAKEIILGKFASVEDLCVHMTKAVARV